MYILDKAMAWTALWMMVVSPFGGTLMPFPSSNPLPFANSVSCFHCHSRAGNWLKIIEWFRNWNRVSIVHKFAMMLSVIGMSFATLQFTPVLALMVISKVPSSLSNPSDGNHMHE